MLHGIRRSDRTTPNPNVRELGADEISISVRGSNLEWIRQSGIRDGVLLVGGTSIAHFRLRIAQSELRQDLLPSFWSSCGLLVGGTEVLTVEMDRVSDVSAHVERNAVERVPLQIFDDARRFPNIALIEFRPDHREVVNQIVRIGRERNIVDLLAQMSDWLAYLWGIPGATNPLLRGVGVPSATLVERAHGLIGADLSPGLVSAASCPEAIWQAARWWNNSVQEDESSSEAYPKGSFTIRQVSAAVVGLRDAMVDSQIVPMRSKDPFFEQLEALRRGEKKRVRPRKSNRPK